MRRTAATLVVVALLATGCSSKPNHPAAPASAAVSAAPSTPTASLTPSDPPSPAHSTTVHPPGEQVTWGDGLKVTVYAYKQPVAAGAPKPANGDGYIWGAADVQVCVSADGDISNRAWLLRYADNTTAEPSNLIYNQFPHPEYPDDRTVTAGMCTRGWITFPVPLNVRPARVLYDPPDTQPAEWIVS